MHIYKKKNRSEVPPSGDVELAQVEGDEPEGVDFLTSQPLPTAAPLPVPSAPPEEQNNKPTVRLTVKRVGQADESFVIDQNWSTLEFKEHSFPDAFRENKNIRMIFQGKLMEDDKTLTESGINVKKKKNENKIK